MMTLSILYSCIPALILYVCYKHFTARISPTVPYVGEESLGSRFKALAEYGADPVNFLVKQREKLGDVFCVDLILLKIVYVLGAEGNKAVLRATEDELSFWEITKRFLGPFVRDELYEKAFFDSINKHLRVGLMSTEMLRNYAESCEDLADEIIDSWTRAPGGKIPLFQSFSDMIYAYSLVMFMGKHFYRKHGAEAIALVKEFAKISRDPTLHLFPHAFWQLLPSGRRGFTIQRQLDELIIQGAAQEHFEQKRLGLSVDDSTYFGYLCKNFDERFVRHLTNHVIFILFASHVNIARTIPWLLLHARCVPGTIQKCREEINSKVPLLDNIGCYLEACLRETSRLYSNLSIMRIVPKNHPDGFVSVLNHQLPRGTLVSCSPLVTQRDCTIFDNPGNWNPERFLSGDSKRYSEWFRRLEFVQFGAGEHTCIGERLTRVVLVNLIMKTWLRKYDFEVISGLKDDEGIDGVGIEADWNKEPNGTPPAMGEVFVRIVKVV